MRFLVVSDTHGRHHCLDEILEKEREIDWIFHAGDVEGGEDYIEAVSPCPVKIVAGNNDFFSSLSRELEWDMDGVHFFMSHGHYYGVSLGVETFLEEAISRKADVAIFGHTHHPFCQQEEGVWLFNPGSLSFPRQKNRRPSYIFGEIREGQVMAEVRYL